jgi:flagellar hook assembly protein FlgD
MIAYYLQDWERAEFSIYNFRGQKVTGFSNSQDYAGDYLLTWNGTDKNGRRLPSGVYIIKLKTREGKGKITRCLLLN